MLISRFSTLREVLMVLCNALFVLKESYELCWDRRLFISSLHGLIV